MRRPEYHQGGWRLYDWTALESTGMRQEYIDLIKDISYSLGNFASLIDQVRENRAGGWVRRNPDCGSLDVVYESALTQGLHFQNARGLVMGMRRGDIEPDRKFLNVMRQVAERWDELRRDAMKVCPRGGYQLHVFTRQYIDEVYPGIYGTLGLRKGRMR